MISANIEFYKGILFVRINNNMKSREYLTETRNIKNIIKRIGIKYLVINMEDISSKNKLYLNFIKVNLKNIKKNKGKLMLCGLNEVNSFHYQDIIYLNNELEALQIINT